MTRRICSIEERSGDNPPCMVKIFSSMMAAIGRQLKQSVNVFHSLMLYLRLPWSHQLKSNILAYIHHRIRKSGWYLHIHGYLEEWRSFRGIWFYMPREDILFLVIVFLGPHSRLRIDSSPREEIHHIRTSAADHNTVRECRLLLEQNGWFITAYFERRFEF